MPVMIVIMLLPIIALPVFWLTPLPQAISIYVISTLLSGLMHWLMHSTKRRPVVTGAESLIGREANVLSRSGQFGNSWQVRVNHELWTAVSDDDLLPGETVMIVTVKGNKLVVKHRDSDTGTGGQK